MPPPAVGLIGDQHRTSTPQCRQCSAEMMPWSGTKKGFWRSDAPWHDNGLVIIRPGYSLGGRKNQHGAVALFPPANCQSMFMAERVAQANRWRRRAPRPALPASTWYGYRASAPRSFRPRHSSPTLWPPIQAAFRPPPHSCDGCEKLS